MFKKYSERKAEKKRKLELEEKLKTRIPDEITKEADVLSGQIGRLHHQKVCLDSQLSAATNQFHKLMLELNDAYKVHGMPKLEIAKTNEGKESDVSF